MSKAVDEKNIKINFAEGDKSDTITVDIVFKTSFEIPKTLFKTNNEIKTTIKEVSQEIDQMIEGYIDELKEELEAE